MPPQPASIMVLRNPLKLTERETYAAEPGTVFIDWLTAHYPAGFGRQVTVLHNARLVEIAELDFVLAEGDVVEVLVSPGIPALGITAASIVTALIVSAITAAVTLIINYAFFRPTRPKSQDTPGPDPIYTLSGAQNAARPGDPIPALYGRIISTPDYASQPYTYFFDNDQFLALILCLGWGEFVVNEVRVGETPVSQLQAGVVDVWQFGPADHHSAMGPIEAATGVYENVVTSPEVADQELSGVAQGDVVEVTEHVWFEATNQISFVNTGPPAGYAHVQVSGSEKNNGDYTIASFNAGTAILTTVETTIRKEEPSGGVMATLRYYRDAEALTVGPFMSCPPGKTGNRLMLDFVFPQGLYGIDPSTGDLLRLQVDLDVEYQRVDDSGAGIGGWTTVPASIVRNTNTPVRVTLQIDVPAGRYRVRVRRETGPSSNGRSVSTFLWTGLKFRLVPSPAPIYREVTLLVVRVKATNGIAGSASTRISADVTRKLPHLGSGPLVATTNPADAFVDIYTNPLYGARRPLTEVDVPELARLSAHWGGAAKFNGGFAQRSTIWEALKISVQTAGAAPLPLGQLMSVAQDGVRALRTQLFSDANIVKGTLAIGYNFDRPGDYDGVRISYRDPATWSELFATYPPGALEADAVDLFGCTDAATANGFAKLLWNKRLMQRKTAQFETELEGLIPRLGDRVAIATQMPRWAAAGLVVRVDGLVLTLDADLDWSGSGHFVLLRSAGGVPSDPITVTPGDELNQLVLAALPPFPLFGTGSQEPTHYAFASSTSRVADFTIGNVEHRGGAAVGIDGVVYNPAVFAGTLPWMEVPI